MIQGETVPPDINVKLELVTKDNVDNDGDQK